MYRLITQDPASGGEMIVTRLECPQSGIVIEGEFGLGWLALLTPDQIDFVGQLLRNRGNVQKLATELGVSYNTARARMDEIVRALGAPAEEEEEERKERSEVLDRLKAGEIAYEEALELLRG
jgi:hypothetical protein